MSPIEDYNAWGLISARGFIRSKGQFVLLLDGFLGRLSPSPPAPPITKVYIAVKANGGIDPLP